MAVKSRAAGVAWLLVNAMLLLLVAGIVVGVIAAVHGLVSGASVPVHGQLPEARVTSLPSGVKLVGDPHVTLEIQDASTKQQLLSAARGVGPALLLLGGLWLLRGLARSIREGEPFGRANVQRLRALGSLLIVGGLVASVVDWALRLSLANTLSPAAFGDVSVEGFRFPFALLLGGLGAFILGEVFAYGVSLREDVEATI
jgi:hypothetical protein